MNFFKQHLSYTAERLKKKKKASKHGSLGAISPRPCLGSGGGGGGRCNAQTLTPRCLYTRSLLRPTNASSKLSFALHFALIYLLIYSRQG